MLTAALLLCLSLAIADTSASAQLEGADTARAAGVSTVPLPTLNGVTRDRARVNRLLGRTDLDGGMLRSASSLLPRPDADTPPGLRWEIFTPEVHTVWNSDLPYSLNEGAMWAGRGLNARVTAGFRVSAGPVWLTVAPHVTYARNEDFQTFDYLGGDERSRFAAPWHTAPESLDAPHRFGDEPFTGLHPGQSTLGIHAGPVDVGLSTKNHWWGPGIRNAIVMSDNAPGFPHLFVRSARPLETRVGEFDAVILGGWLRESDYFEEDPGWDRGISALAATFRPAGEPNLTLGFARAVVSNRRTAVVPFHIFNVLADAGRPNDQPPEDLDRSGSLDGFFSLFGRWVFPASGFEAYAEWSRQERPASLRDLLVLPNHTQGYTLGGQWARPVGAGSAVRLQAELTTLEKSSSFRQRRVVGFYKSRPIPQGYTHDGRVLGAGIGTGASSQWLAADYIAPNWQVGMFGGRIRWDNDVMPLFQRNNATAHDVTVLGGLRAAVLSSLGEISLEYTNGLRYNYLFQNRAPQAFIDPISVDIRNHTVRMTVRPGF